MIKHILVPLDGSTLAECVLPHAVALARTSDATITLLEVLEIAHKTDIGRAVNPLDWQFVRVEAQRYLEEIAGRLHEAGMTSESIILEGHPPENIVEYARQFGVDLILLSSHGKSGLSGWNISSVVQKIISHSSVSVYLVRAYQTTPKALNDLRYQRLMVGLDGSQRAECVLQVASNLASYYKARLLLAHVASRPIMLRREPLSLEEDQLVDQIVERNIQEANRYLEALASRMANEGIELEKKLCVGENPYSALHELVDEEKVDLVVLSAHGYTGDVRRLYGGVATNFIAYGTTPLLIVQDLSSEEIRSIFKVPIEDRRKP
jgi:nucleotide-binding universal stress UspA family protein